MPNCFTLTPKASQEQGPVKLQTVDDDMRIYFEAEPSDKAWYKNWYDTIGLGLALGKTWAELRVFFPDKVAVIDYLERYYTTDAWYEHQTLGLG